MWKRVNSGLVIFVLIAQILFVVSNIVSLDASHEDNEYILENNGEELFLTKKLSDKTIRMELKVINFTIQQQSQQSLWWDREWGYRANISVIEPSVCDRSEWPVNVYLSFSSSAHKYSVRVVEVLSSYPYLQEVKYQLWNVTYHNQTHIESATITFLVSIQKGGTKQFQIYWSINEKNPPSYTKAITISKQSTPDGTKYVVMSERGWSVEIPPASGGRISNMTLSSGDEIGHTYLHYGVTRNYTLDYEGYMGTGDTNNDYVWRGIVEEEESLTGIYSGVIFATYSVRNISMYDQYVGDIAVVNYTYRFYPWGLIVNESAIWKTSDNAEYIVGGWVFDQDDGSGALSTFNRVGRKNNITKLPETYSYPSMYGILSVSWSHLF